MTAEAPARETPQTFLKTPVAGMLPVFVHWAAALLFAAFCGRLIFATLIQQGLPGQPGFWIFWVVAAAWFLPGLLAPRAGLIGFLAGFPVLCGAQELRAIPLGNLVPVCFSALFLGWILRSAVVEKHAGPRDVAGFSVDCLALALLASAVFSLIHPSLINSFSVAFSIPSWPEKTEFSGLTMGLNAATGCMLFGMLRHLLRGHERWLTRIVGIQFAGICLFALPELAWNVMERPEAGRNLISLPFGVVHNLGGPACLFAGYFLTLAAMGWKARSGLLAVLPAGFLALLVVAGSVSKGAWLAVALTGILLVLRTVGWKPALAALLALVVAAGILRVTLPGKLHQGSAAEHLSAVVSADRWMRNGTLTERLQIWGKATAVIAASPLAGVGLGSFPSIMEHYGDRSFPGSKVWWEYSHAERSLNVPDDQVTYNGFHCHNDILELAAGAGLPTAILFVALVAALIFCGLRSDQHGVTALAAAFALICFFFVSMIDSRLLSFPDNLLFWQFAACILAGSSLRGAEAPARRAWLASLAPASVILGGALLVISGGLPSNTTFGVWNWGLPSGDGGFLLAREAQFVIPPDEDLKALALRNAGEGSLRVRVFVDGSEIPSLQLAPDQPTLIDMQPFRTDNRWLLVRIEADRWAGRGALGSPFGVKPYSFSLRKIRE